MISDNEQMIFELPYGDGILTVPLPDKKKVKVYQPMDLPGVTDGSVEVHRAMQSPIASPPLAQIAKGKKNAVILVDDTTRPVPTAALLEPILDELALGGLTHEQVTVVVATGLHRPVSDSEAKTLLGGLDLKWVNHDAKDHNALKKLGTTSFGGEIYLNRLVMEADLRILTGDIELHQFAGYGGGAKSILPGIADAASVERSHSMMEMEGTGPGRYEGNPVRQEIEEAAEMLGIHFMVNVVLNDQKQIVKAFAGDVREAFKTGIELVDQMYKVSVDEPADIVLSSPGGYPKDINLYQSQKAVASARRMVKKGGKIILFAQCREGHGSDLAYEWARQAKTIQDIIVRHQKAFCLGGHKAFQLARDIAWAPVYIHSDMPNDTVETFFMKPLIQIQRIKDLLAQAESIAVLPQATCTLSVLS